MWKQLILRQRVGKQRSGMWKQLFVDRTRRTCLHSAKDSRKLKQMAAAANEVIMWDPDYFAPSINAVGDPGKLVLEALQEFHPPGFSKGEVVDSEIKRNCVVLLEEFGRVRDGVEPHVREEAKRLAVEWKGRVENSLEALGEAPELLRALGFAHKASVPLLRAHAKYAKKVAKKEITHLKHRMLRKERNSCSKRNEKIH
ncbi:hypothetical protein Patl1_23430 [Pistacia atlantica]|uniref:Uncharacterized protein n=1 Tax=Pistacia atlantica TaxID=434234 RepID=A0ACC1A2F1_9ROSI|nr:hypothetical protein Patl1_23430 [Pistacia atlantica]